MPANHFDMNDVDILLLEIEELFERFRRLSQSTRAIILAKLKIKLLEEFKDFVIQESDINQETVIEISYRGTVEDNTKDVNIIELPVELTEEIENYCETASINDTANEYSTIETVHVEGNVTEVREIDQSNDLISEEDVEESKTCFICNYCGKQYGKMSLFKVHLKRHENSKEYECANCSSRFNAKEDLIRHLRTHTSEKNYKCSICSKLFVSNFWLRNHMSAIHEKNEKHFCQKCDYFCFTGHTLKQHIKLKHHQPDKKYPCLVCKKIFVTRVELKVHLRAHTGEKPYQCTLCNAAFIVSGRLTNHMKSIHAERKFSCDICTKSFPTVHKLKRHLIIHTRSKPFACPYCKNYAGNTPGNLNKHVKVAHQINDFTYSKYKKRILGQTEDIQLSEECIKNAESVTNEYLKTLPNQDRPLTVEQLKQQYLQQNKKKTSEEDTETPNKLDNL